MAIARLNGLAIASWDAFHTACALEFGFPDFYGRNGNAWIDSLTYINEGDGMSRFVLAAGELLRIEVSGSDYLKRRSPEILAALMDWTDSVNRRSIESGDIPRIELALL